MREAHLRPFDHNLVGLDMKESWIMRIRLGKIDAPTSRGPPFAEWNDHELLSGRGMLRQMNVLEGVHVGHPLKCISVRRELGTGLN